MPRAFDPSLPGGGLPITHSPLNRIRINPVVTPFDLQDLIDQISESWENILRDFVFPTIEELTGIDLSVLLSLLDELSLDFSSPAALLLSLIDAAVALPAVILQVVVSIFNQIMEMTGIDLNVFLPLLNLLDLDFSNPAAFLQSLFAAALALPAIVTDIVSGLVLQLKEITGVDLTEFLPILDLLELDFSNPSAFLSSLVTAITNVPAVAEQFLVALIDLIVNLPETLLSLANALIGSGAGLLGPSSLLNAFNLFGTLPGNVFSSVPIGALTNALSNIIPLAGFFQPGSIASGGGWLVDTLTNLNGSGSGSAKVIADGVVHGLLGTLISVVPGQVFNLSAMTKWTGLTATGSPIQFGLVGLLNGVPVLNTVLASITSPGSASSGWQPLSGLFTVPAGIDTIRVRLGLTDTATSGTVWFSGITGTQPGEIAQTWVKDLPEQFEGILDILGLGSLADLIGPNVTELWTDLIETILNPLGVIQDLPTREDLQEVINNIIKAVEGIPVIGGTIAEMFDAVEEIFDTALDGQALGTDALADIQDTINWVWQSFSLDTLVGNKTGGQIYNAALDFMAVLAQGPANMINVNTNQTENTQTKQILSGVVITPINTLISTIKSWYDLHF